MGIIMTNPARQAAERIVECDYDLPTPLTIERDTQVIEKIIQEAIDAATAEHAEGLYEIIHAETFHRQQSDSSSCQLISDLLRERIEADEDAEHFRKLCDSCDDQLDTDRLARSRYRFLLFVRDIDGCFDFAPCFFGPIPEPPEMPT